MLKRSIVSNLETFQISFSPKLGKQKPPMRTLKVEDRIEKRPGFSPFGKVVVRCVQATGLVTRRYDIKALFLVKYDSNFGIIRKGFRTGLRSL